MKQFFPKKKTDSLIISEVAKNRWKQEEEAKNAKLDLMLEISHTADGRPVFSVGFLPSSNSESKIHYKPETWEPLLKRGLLDYDGRFYQFYPNIDLQWFSCFFTKGEMVRSNYLFSQNKQIWNQANLYKASKTIRDLFQNFPILKLELFQHEARFLFKKGDFSPELEEKISEALLQEFSYFRDLVLSPE